MKNYRLLIKGCNFLLPVNGKPKKHRFSQYLIVEADGHKQAELLGLATIRNNKELKEMMLNAPNDPPEVYLDTIWEYEEYVDITEFGSERTFSIEKRWWQFWK